MTLRVIGAGVGRTGTLSLKAGLERLLGAPCYHMLEVMPHPEHVPVWHAAARGEPVDWFTLMNGYAAAVDWPASAFWPELAAAFPDAVLVLSTRSAESWWKSASETIFPVTLSTPDTPWKRMVDTMFAARFTSDIENKAACIAAYEAHNRVVRETAPRTRLIEWQAQDGWEPLCRALDLPVPAEPFPHVNSTAEFQQRIAERREH